MQKYGKLTWHSRSELSGLFSIMARSALRVVAPLNIRQNLAFSKSSSALASPIPSKYILSCAVVPEFRRHASSSSKAPPKKSGLFGKAVVFGVAFGSVYGYYSYEQRKKQMSKPASGTEFMLKEPPPNVAVSRRVSCFIVLNHDVLNHACVM